MGRIAWDETGEKLYETGVDRVVLYPTNNAGAYQQGVPWISVTSVQENPSGADATKLYADNNIYATLYSLEEFGATIEAYTSPEEFDECDGTRLLAPGVHVGQQTRKAFGLAYRTGIGNDVADAYDFGYTIHLVYGAKAAPSSRSHATINESPNAEQLSWGITTTPIHIADGMKKSAHIYIKSTDFENDAQLKAFENILYGVDAPVFSAEATYAVGDYVTQGTTVYKCINAVTTAGEFNGSDWEAVTNPGPRLPLPEELKAIFAVG